MSDSGNQNEIKKTGRRNLLFKLRPVFRWILKFRGSTRSVAGGLGLGTFIAFTPAMGLHVVMALCLATLFNLNRPAAVVPVWITNPVTMAPIYTFNYWVGCFFMDGPPVKVVSKEMLAITAQIAKMDFFSLKEQIITFYHLGQDIIFPLVIGSLVVGIISGGIVYVISLNSLAFLQRKRRKKNRLH
jgi:uncharacterized protein (DUF2062 family)